MEYRGTDIDLNNRERWIAIVGSRNANEQEMHMAFEFARKCAEKDFIVVSGLAEGIDTAAHKGAIAGNGKTIAIVSTSLEENIYPKSNGHLAKEIMQSGGILFPYQTKAPNKRPGEKGMSVFQKRLIERDVLVAYLNPRIFTVKDSPEKISGGTKWAMNYADVYGKEAYRIDANGKIYKNPDVEKSSVFWDMEMNVESIFNIH